MPQAINSDARRLHAGADEESPNEDGQTALMLTARTGSVEVAELVAGTTGRPRRSRLSWRGNLTVGGEFRSARFVLVLGEVRALGRFLMLTGFPAQGHHSVIGMYDPEMQVTLTGVVAEFHFTRPHPYLVLDIDPGEEGAWRWHLEFDNHRELANIGVDADTFRPGDELVVTGDFARDGSERMYVRELHRPEDGLLYACPGFRPSLKVVR